MVLMFAFYIALPLLMLSFFFAFIRLLRGPSLADRVVALDILGIIGIGIVGVYSVIWETSSLIDVAIIIALITFLSTIGFATYLERRMLK